MAMMRYLKGCIIFVFLLLINVEVSKTSDSKNFICKQKGNCLCVQEDKSFIDISPLENYTDSRFRFLSYSNNEVVYFYHPCSDFPITTSFSTQCSNGCTLCFFRAAAPSEKNLDVDAVLKNQFEGIFYNLAYAGQSVFLPAESEIDLVFKSQNVSTTIHLECDESSGAKTLFQPKDPKVINITHHELILRSPYSCFRNLSPDKHHMSGWGVFFLILLIAASAYLFGGMLILKLVKGATGTEIIPNYDFWVSLPERVKSCCAGLRGKESQGSDSYERI